MKNNSNDFIELKDAYNNAIIDPESSIKKLKKYLEKHPKYYFGHCFLINLLIDINRLDEARKLVEYIDSTGIKEDFDSKDKLMANLVLSKIRLLFFEKKYDECLETCYDNYHILKRNKIWVKTYEFACSVKLGYPVTLNTNREEYFLHQVMNYSEEKFREHIKKHIGQEEAIDEDEESSCFNPDFPIDKMIEEVKTKIFSYNRYNSTYCEYYIFKYDNCGTIKEHSTDYFKVIVLPGSNNLVSIFPVGIKEKYRYISLNHVLMDEQPLIKKISRIDKFNQKYGIK